MNLSDSASHQRHKLKDSKSFVANKDNKSIIGNW